MNDFLIDASVFKGAKKLALFIPFNNSYYVGFKNKNTEEMSIRIFKANNKPINISERYDAATFESELNKNKVSYFKVICENKVIFIPKDRLVCVDEVGILDRGNDILLRSTTGEYFQICTDEKIHDVLYVPNGNNKQIKHDIFESITQENDTTQTSEEIKERKINVPKIDLGF